MADDSSTACSMCMQTKTRNRVHALDLQNGRYVLWHMDEPNQSNMFLERFFPVLDCLVCSGFVVSARSFVYVGTRSGPSIVSSGPI